MNKVILMGRLTRGADVRYTQDSKCVARFSFAVNRRFAKEGEQSADFVNCVAFGKIGEFIEKYAHQGTKLVVEGRIQTGSYTNKEGAKVYTTDIVVESCEFAESKSAAGNNSAPATNNDGFMDIPDDVSDEGLPFN